MTKECRTKQLFQEDHTKQRFREDHTDRIKPSRENRMKLSQGNHHQNKPGQRRKAKNEEGVDYTKMMDLLKTETSGHLEAEGVEKTYRFSQDQLTQEIPMQSAKKRFDLKLTDGGAYNVDYTRDGRFLLLAGKRGHVAAMEWERGRLRCELNLGEKVRDAKWLQNESFFAVAQTNYVYVYDTNGSEVHRLAKNVEVDYLEYLPYHFLLAAVGGRGILRYQDMTTGQLIGEHHFKDSRSRSMRQNSSNGIIHLGHANGCVTLWSPSVGSPLVTMQCHAGPIEAIAFDPQGTYMATSSLDGKIKIWDMRKFRYLHEYYPVRPATTLDISQRGVMAVGYGHHITMWKDCLGERAKEPYMYHQESGSTVSSLRFCPYDDVLGIGHTAGFSSVLIPGAGEPNYDSYEVNPFASRNHRREATVKQLLDKLPPETIMLDPTSIGTIAKTDEERRLLKLELEGNRPQRKNKDRGSLYKQRRRENIIEEELKQRDIVVESSKRQFPGKKTALDRFKLGTL